MELSCHPALLLGDILEVFFKKLPFEELKKCRQVCRKWEKVSKKLVENQSQLRISGGITRNFALGEFLRQDSHLLVPSKLKVAIFCDDELENEIRVREDVNSGLVIDRYNGRLRKGIEDMYEILGKLSFQELEIYLDKCSEYPQGHLLNILRHLSTLKSLKVCEIPEYAMATGKKIPDGCPLLTKLTIEPESAEWLYHRIFLACPNLKEINGYYDEHVSCPVRLLRNSPGGLTKILGFSCWKNEDWEMLRRKSGNLTELRLEFDESETGESILEFLQTKRESLEFLELKFARNHETFRLGQAFTQLTKLHLKMPSGATQFLLEICFSKDTPQLKYFKLEKLELSNEWSWKSVLAYSRNVTNAGRVIPLRTLTHLDLQLGRLVDRECANYLRMLFPSLTSFKIRGPTEGFLRGLWQWGSLIEIHMDIRDPFWKDYQDIEDLGVALFGNQQDQENEETILNLKKLRYLYIEKRVWNLDGHRISDVTVKNGFGNIKRLAVLKLPQSQMTPESKEYLKANLPFLKELDVSDFV